MRPFTKDSQKPVVITVRRKSKLEAPKLKSAAALVKRKNRNAQRKQDDAEGNDLEKDSCQFVPVRRKPLGEYMNLDEPSSSTSLSVQSMPMSYAAAVQNGLGVKVLITPRPTKTNKTGKGKATKKFADTKLRTIDEQPKPHIVRSDPKVLRSDVELKAKKKSLKPKKQILSITQNPKKGRGAKTVSDDADVKALELEFKKLSCTAEGSSTARNLNLIQGNALAASHEERYPAFVDSVSYLSYHQERLQRIIKKQNICVLCMQSPEPMEIPRFGDRRFKYLEEAALLAQNRIMLRLWNSDQRIS